jgi:hypothetical protein
MPREGMAIAAGGKENADSENVSYARDPPHTHTLITDFANTILQKAFRQVKGRRGRGCGRLRDSTEVTNMGHGTKGTETETQNYNDGNYLLPDLGFVEGSMMMKVKLGNGTTDDPRYATTYAEDVKLKGAAGVIIGELHTTGLRPRKRNPEIDETIAKRRMVDMMLAERR